MIDTRNFYVCDVYAAYAVDAGCYVHAVYDIAVCVIYMMYVDHAMVIVYMQCTH